MVLDAALGCAVCAVAGTSDWQGTAACGVICFVNDCKLNESLIGLGARVTDLAGLLQFASAEAGACRSETAAVVLEAGSAVPAVPSQEDVKPDETGPGGLEADAVLGLGSESAAACPLALVPVYTNMKFICCDNIQASIARGVKSP